MKNAILILLLVSATTFVKGAEVFTGENTNTVFTVHGRLRNYMGYAQMRIWVVGSTRILGVEEETGASKKIGALFPKGGWFDYSVYGDFTVEPLAPDIKGHKRPVRILKVHNVVVERDSDKKIVFTQKNP